MSTSAQNNPPPSDRDVLVLANQAWSRGELRAAYSQITGRFGQTPDKKPVAIGLARLLLEMGRAGEAVALVDGIQDEAQGPALEGIRSIGLISDGSIDEGRMRLEALVAAHGGLMPAAAVLPNLDLATGNLAEAAARYEALSSHLQEGASALVWNALSCAARLDFTDADNRTGAAEQAARVDTSRGIRPSGGDAIRFTPITLDGPSADEVAEGLAPMETDPGLTGAGAGRVTIAIAREVGFDGADHPLRSLGQARGHVHIIGDLTDEDRAALPGILGAAVSLEPDVGFSAGGAECMALARAYLWLKSGTAAEVALHFVSEEMPAETDVSIGVPVDGDADMLLADRRWLVPWRRFDLQNAVFRNTSATIRFLGRAVARIMDRPIVDARVAGDRWLAQSALYGAWYETVIVREEALTIASPSGPEVPPLLEAPLPGGFQPTEVELLNQRERADVSQQFRDVRLALDIPGIWAFLDGFNRNQRLRWRNINREISARNLGLRAEPDFIGHKPSGPAKVDGSLKENSLRGWAAGRLVETKMSYEPYPHAVVSDLLPADTYADMLEELPDLDALAWGTNADYPDRGEIGVDKAASLFGPAIQAALVLFNDRPMLSLLLERLGLEHVLSRCRSAGLEAVIKARLTIDRTKYSLGPHIDAERRLATVLYYLPRTDADADVGTVICRPKPGIKGAGYGLHGRFEHYEILDQAPYLPNTAFAFANVGPAYHGVLPIDRTLIRPMIQYTVYLVNA